MSGVALSIQVRGASLKRKGLENLKAAIPVIGAERIYTMLKRVLVIMKKPGAKIYYPVNWDSERQRRAFFASNGFGRGIPTERTGAYNRAWYIRRNPRPGRAQVGYTLANYLPRAKYIGGDTSGNRQSRIHRNRWTLVRVAMERERQGLRNDVRNHIVMKARAERLV